jgi:uncharacterized membrane protein YeaQ/YmgE (transglycosylase-associated protein family)
MTTQSLILFLVIGCLAGFLAGKIMKGSGFGLVGDLVVGVLGAFIGGWVFSLLGIAAGGIIGALITALVGALLLLYLVRLVKKGLAVQHTGLSSEPARPLDAGLRRERELRYHRSGLHPKRSIAHCGKPTSVATR